MEIGVAIFVRASADWVAGGELGAGEYVERGNHCGNCDHNNKRAARDSCADADADKYARSHDRAKAQHDRAPRPKLAV